MPAGPQADMIAELLAEIAAGRELANDYYNDGLYDDSLWASYNLVVGIQDRVLMLEAYYEFAYSPAEIFEAVFAENIRRW